MTVYYVPNIPIYDALAVITQSSAFVLVARRVEFWVFVCGHVFSVFLVKTYNINTTEWSDFKWDLISINVLFVTVFLTFYNGPCFNRHQQFYETCMRAVDSTLLFVWEMVTSLPLKDHHKHRVQACKYAMAMLHISFLVSSTGNMKRSTWREMQRRGLLDKGECDLLASFPAVRSPDQIMILANWAMQVVDAALAHEVPAVAKAAVHTHTHHVHTGGLWMTASHSRQRLNRHVTDILTELHSLGDLLAMPVPFPYYHAMNVVIVTSLMLFSFMATLFKTYLTVFPFAVSLLFLLAIREISTIVTDPFRADEIGFPLHSFLEYCFDHSCCLLLAFNNENAYTVASVVEHTEAFSTEEITHRSLAQDVFRKGFEHSVASTFAWNTEMPIRQLYGHVDKASDIMTSVFNGRLDRYRRQQEQKLAELDEVTSQTSSKISVSSKRKKYKGKAAASKGSTIESTRSTHLSRLLRAATHRFVHGHSVEVDLDKQELAEVEREIRLTERDNAALERQVAVVRGKLNHVQEMLQKLVTVAPVETDIKDVSLIPQRPKPRTEPETQTQEVEEEVLDFLDARRVIAEAIDALRLSPYPEATRDTTAQLASAPDEYVI